MSVLVRATSHPNNEINVVFCASKHKSKRNVKCSVLRRQCSDTNQNIKRFVSCRYG